MKPRKRIVDDTELPPIAFSIKKEDIEGDNRMQGVRQDIFFQSFFDANNAISNSQHTDLERKHILQNKMLQNPDMDNKAYERAKNLRDNQVTLQQIQGDEYVSEDSERLSDVSLDEFWKVEGEELEKERKKLKDERKKDLFNTNEKIEVDSKLQQYLSIHSMNLTSSVRNFIE